MRHATSSRCEQRSLSSMWTSKLLNAMIAYSIARSRIGDAKAVDARKGRHLVQRGGTSIDHVLHAKTTDTQRVGDKRAMAAPGHFFSAHQDTAIRLREVDDPDKRVFEFGRLHVIGVTSERRVAPAGING